MKAFICIKCSIGCHLVYDNGKIIGNRCKRGETYGLEEVLNPKRMITTTVKTTNPQKPRLSVKTSKSIPKELIFEVMKEIKRITIFHPVKIGQILKENILDLGVDVIATDNFSL